jgi:LmbE family N-acetylglucosaminyl deacetylase
VVFFLPHQDDELLSMGVFVRHLVDTHHDVRLVLYTSGAATGVCAADRRQICRGHNEFRGLTTARFVALRDSELRHSAAALGVPAGKVRPYAPDGVRRLDGTVTVAYAETMLRSYRHQFPQATFVTMSWLDRHPDHAAGGLALRALVRDGTIPANRAMFALYRRYWAYDYPHRASAIRTQMDQLRVARGYPLSARLFRCTTPTCRADLHRAVLAYYPHRLGGSGYGIGYRSAREYLAVTDGDPESLVHGAATGRYPLQASITSVRAARGRATLHASITVPDFGRYGTDPDQPASALDLAEALRGSSVQLPLPPGTPVQITARDAAGHVLATSHLPLDGTRVAGTIRLPKSAVRLTLTTAGSDGARPTRTSVSLG